MLSWLELERRFREAEPGLERLSLQYQTSSIETYVGWQLSGVQHDQRVRKFELLCRLAGQQMEQCGSADRVVEGFVALESDPLGKWYRALRDISGESSPADFVAIMKDDTGQTIGHVSPGRVESVVGASANLCLLLETRCPVQEEASVERHSINISNSTVGFLNTGQVERVESISTHLETLQQTGETDVAEALKRLTEAIANSSELDACAKMDVLEQLDELSEQALFPSEQRAKSTFLKASVGAIAAAVNVAGSLTTVWATFGPTIQAYFKL